MDDHTRHRRLNDSLGHHASNSKYTSQQSPALPVSNGRGNRFHLSSNTSPQTPRAMGTGTNHNSYYQEPTNSFTSSTNMSAYGSDYGQDSRQQSHQSFGGYNPTAMMYSGVTQPNPQAPVYDAQQFGSRQSAALSMMTPDVTSTYFGNEPASTSAPGLHHSAPSSATGMYQHQSSAVNYSADLPGVGGAQQAPASADVSVPDEPEFSEGALEEKWLAYQQKLGTVFQNIFIGALQEAAETLLTISDWLLSQVVDLGLTVDDANLHAGRIKLWNDFNHAWLALGQRQLDYVESGQRLSRSQNILSREALERMGDELIRLCDGLERHGLVDYQYGVWEDQIVAVLEDCLDLYDSHIEAEGDVTARE